jgi:OFA family oxalate/formate antiporter-like MFS transporter
MTYPNRCLFVLCAACLLSAVLGSVHAFSVFVQPLEDTFNAKRSTVSLIYSLALVSLTVAVLFGHQVYGRWSPCRFVLIVGLISGFGALIAALAPNIWFVIVGYSLFFGAANGLGYGYGLQIAAQAYEGREGMAIGLVTAAYAFGAAVSPSLFSIALNWGGFQAAMLLLMITVIIAALISADLLKNAQFRFQISVFSVGRINVDRMQITLLWLGYGTGVACGLMAIGHAVGIAGSLDFVGPIWIAPAAIAICNLMGSVLAGRMIDKFSGAVILTVLPIISGLAVFALGGLAMPGLTLFCLGLVGLTYGGIIAAYPATISKIYGLSDSARIYGRVFTAWGTAGLFAPWFAGALFDWTGGYQFALLVSGGLGLISSICIVLYFKYQ